MLCWGRYDGIRCSILGDSNQTDQHPHPRNIYAYSGLRKSIYESLWGNVLDSGRLQLDAGHLAQVKFPLRLFEVIMIYGCRLAALFSEGRHRANWGYLFYDLHTLPALPR